MKIFTYWENESDVTSIPAYILLSIVTMRLKLGNSFHLLTPRSIRNYVPPQLIDKKWRFTHASGHLSPELMRIVATSDFLRIYIVAEHGGGWIDADTIVLRDFRAELSNLVGSNLLYHSEQFFCSLSGNPLLRQVADNMINADRLVWGNPGGIHDIVRANKDKVDFVPVSFYDPGYTPTYSAKSYDVMFSRDVSSENFLTNSKQYIQKLYNSAFVKFVPRDQSISDFLSSDMLIARIFLALRNDTAFWIGEGGRVYEELSEAT